MTCSGGPGFMMTFQGQAIAWVSRRIVSPARGTRSRSGNLIGDDFAGRLDHASGGFFPSGNRGVREFRRGTWCAAASRERLSRFLSPTRSLSFR